jgi:8-oxo-dGTP pyrophosphatase MutT (NUDIX family)
MTHKLLSTELNPSPESQLAEYLLRYPSEAAGLEALKLQLAEEPGSVFDRSNMRGHITTSAIVLDSGLKNVLMIDHKALKEWLQPGGHYETDTPWKPESLYVSAMREVEEETGVTKVTPLRYAEGHGCLLDIDTHAIPANPKKGEGAHFHHDFVYLASAAYGVRLKGQEEEVDGVKWVPLQEFAAMPRKRFARIVKKMEAFSWYKPT